MLSASERDLIRVVVETIHDIRDYIDDTGLEGDMVRRVPILLTDIHGNCRRSIQRLKLACLLVVPSHASNRYLLPR